MYAIIKTGGKQYRAEVGNELEIELLDAAVGEEVKIPAVMTVSGAEVKTKNVTVSAKVMEHGKGEKLNIFKYKAKKNQRKRQGHRQPYTRVKILKIN